MKFIADENIFVPIVESLRERGHDVFDIKEHNLQGTEDLEVFRIAVNQERVLLTMDKDFADIIKYPPGSHAGIIVLKLYKLTVDTATNIFIKSFDSIDNHDITGNTVIIDKNKTRVRKRPTD